MAGMPIWSMRVDTSRSISLACKKSAYKNDGHWSSVYAGRILKDTRASAYNRIEDLRMKIMLRPLEDVGAPPLYVNGKPVYN